KGLYEKQRDKLSTDLRKLCDRYEDFAKLLGGTSIHRYVFLVPRHDSKDLIVHANKKAAEVLNWQLPFIHISFQIVIETDDDYSEERQELQGLPEPLLSVEPVTDNIVTAWADDNPELRNRTLRKIEKIENPPRVESITNLIIKEFIRGENRFEVLRSNSPELYRDIRPDMARQEELLFLYHPEENNQN